MPKIKKADMLRVVKDVKELRNLICCRCESKFV